MIGSAKESIHSTLVVILNGQKFRAMLDMGAQSLFASSTFICHLGVKPSCWEWRNIETMTTTVHQKLPIYDVKLFSNDSKEELDVQLTMLDKPIITTLSNPKIGELKNEYPHLRGLCFDNEDDCEQHPIHLILGVGDFTQIKILERRRHALVILPKHHIKIMKSSTTWMFWDYKIILREIRIWCMKNLKNHCKGTQMEATLPACHGNQYTHC